MRRAKRKFNYYLKSIKRYVRRTYIGIADAVSAFFERMGRTRSIAILAGAGAVVIAGVLCAVLIPTGAHENEVAAVPAQNVRDVYTAPAPTATPEPTPVPILLNKGDTDEELVPAIQHRLMELNYMDFDEPTPLFGPTTLQAIKAFQRRSGMEPDGVINNAVYDLLMNDDAVVYVASAGDEGDDITEIQQRLVELDYLKSGATGYFGTDTEAAVKKFQKTNSLKDDGKVGEQTKEMLYSDSAKPNYAAYGEVSEEIKTLQQRLKKLGYLNTEPDGIFGRDTVTAVGLFQEQHELIADGYIGPQTKTLLMSSSAKYFTVTLGMSGSAVKKIQQRLCDLKYIKKSGIDGYFGENTEKAVKAFQKRNKLSQDGKIGKNTSALLYSDSAKKAASTTPAATSKPQTGGADTPPQQPETPSATGSADALIAIAKSKLGCPYRGGHKGSDSFDCSGFVYWCLNKAGVTVKYMTSYTWRTTDKFRRIGSLSDVRKGDIIVFTMGKRKGHVAIAAGDGMMYDASSGKGKVVYRSCVSSWCQSSFLCAYRVF